MKQTWLKGIGQRRVTTFSKLDFKKLADSVHCKVLLFAGQLEVDTWPVIGERTADAHQRLKNSRLTIVKDAGHDVADKQYIAAIEKTI